MGVVNFFSEDIDFKLPHPRKTADWIKRVVKREKSTILGVNFIFCSDSYLLQANIQYLKHRTLTDIITFDYSASRKTIEGDVFISIERVVENASKFSNSFDDELHRVIIHGILHLLGHRDKTAKEKTLIRKQEDVCLSLRR
jgi:probable rRNA maturation factor